MSARPGELRRPIIRVVEGFRWLFAILGAPAVVYLSVKWIGDALTLSAGVQMGIMIGLTILLLLAFLGTWMFVATRDWIRDRCLPGYSENSANGLLVVARKAIPDLPNRRRNKVVMAVGLGSICVQLRRVSNALMYFGQKRISVLMKELPREVVVDIALFADKSKSLSADFTEFRQWSNPAMRFAYGFNAASDPTKPAPVNRHLFEETELGLKRVSNDLAQLQKEAKKRAKPPSGPKKKELEASLKELRDDLSYFKEILERLRESLDALENYCKSDLLRPLSP